MKSEWRNCFKCNYEAICERGNCPRCRTTRLRSAGEIRLLGFLMTVIGTLLLAMMSVISVVCASLIFAPPKPGSNVRFTGDETDIAFIFGIFAVVLIIGLLSASAGVWQLIFGRRNLVLLRLSIWLGFALLIGGELILAIVQRI